MRRTILGLAILTFLLAACAGNSPDASPANTPAAVAMATETPRMALSSPSPTAAAVTPETQISPTPVTTLVEYQLASAESLVTYEVGETFFNQNNRFNVAIGETDAISGTLQLDLTNPQNTKLGTITVDISTFKSDSERRDRAIRERFLESQRYPVVAFVPVELQGLPNTYTAGETLAFQVLGDLTIRETTRAVTFEVQVRLDEGILQGEATTTILMSDFGFGPIQMAGVLGTEDEVRLMLMFVARPSN